MEKQSILRTLILLVSCLFLLMPLARGQLSVSENGRYLVTPDGTPFLWLGDTGWGLFQKLTREDVDFYFKARAEQGFSVVHAALAHKNPFVVPGLENIYGDPAFADEASLIPALTEGNDPDDDQAYDYWDHVDYIVDRANEHGLYLVFLPIFGLAEDDGYNLINPGNASDYGRFLGKRYKDKTNIIWCMGGDVLAGSQKCKTIWNLLAKAITEAVAGKEDYAKTLMTYHVRGGHSSSQYFENAPWIDIHMIQTWASYTRIYNMVSKDYHNEVVRPVLHGEGAYEDGPEYPTKPITPLKIRNQAYWATFAGGMHTYGNSNTWSFGTSAYYVTKDWKEAVFSEGAENLSVYHQFFKSIKWWEFVPDQSIISKGVGAEDSLNVAMYSERTDQVLVYLSGQSEVALDLKNSIKAKKTTGEWINPKTGERRNAGNLKPAKSMVCKTPDGWDDALLLIGKD